MSVIYTYLNSEDGVCSTKTDRAYPKPVEVGQKVIFKFIDLISGIAVAKFPEKLLFRNYSYLVFGCADPDAYRIWWAGTPLRPETASITHLRTPSRSRCAFSSSSGSL